jgi:hypothetical protein
MLVVQRCTGSGVRYIYGVLIGTELLDGMVAAKSVNCKNGSNCGGRNWMSVNCKNGSNCSFVALKFGFYAASRSKVFLIQICITYFFKTSLTVRIIQIQICITRLAKFR